MRIVGIVVDDDDGGLIITTIVAVLILIFCAFFGLYTIPEYGGGFLRYVFLNYLFYVFIAIIIILNTVLFLSEVSVSDVAITESVVGFIVYMVLGCKAYSAFGAWDEMSSFLETVLSFFGLIWMSLFFCLASTALCMGVAVAVCCFVDFRVKKNSPRIQTQRKASKQTVKDYIASHTSESGKFNPEYGDTWKCSLCKEWTSMSQPYCSKCTQRRSYTDAVKCAGNKKS